MISIAVDAMGGDHAPSAIVDGAVAAARRFATGDFIHRVEQEIAAASVSYH
jgi:fatty acid/phospholipid biosynthesis enzyme